MLRIFSSRASWLIGIGLFLAVSVAGTPRACAQDANAATMADLQQRIQDLEAVVQQLQANRAPAPVLPGPAMVAPSNYNSPPSSQPGAAATDFTGWNNGFFLQSPDRSCQLRITGQIQTDFRGFFTPVDTSTTANTHVAGSPITGSPDSFLIRRARLGIEATMANYYEFRLLPDFAGSSVSKSITDAYLNVHYWDALQFETGKFKQPFSYEQLIQDRYVPSMERSMMDQLVPQRDEGAMVHCHQLLDGRFDIAAAISNGDANDSTIDNNQHKDFNGRVVFHPFGGPDGWDSLRYLGFGLSGGVGVETEALSTSSSTPPIITTPATVTWFAFNTGVVANGERDRISPELTYFYHSLGFASQYYHEDQVFQAAAAHSPLVDVPFDGFYFLATYLLTGEQRTDYSQQIEPLRPFDPCRPGACPGAWELLCRVDRMAVGESAFEAGLASDTGTTNRSSNEATEVTVGLNWYLTKWVRAQLNYEHANFASPVQIGNAPRPFSSEDALYTRFQVIF
jgi:phosphate-selective porin OprO/OprP